MENDLQSLTESDLHLVLIVSFKAVKSKVPKKVYIIMVIISSPTYIFWVICLAKTRDLDWFCL